LTLCGCKVRPKQFEGVVYEDKKTSEFICILAENSSGIIKPYFSQLNLAVEIRGDQTFLTLVTHADHQAEAVMWELILKMYLHSGIFGEYFGLGNTSAEFAWFLDPKDGTISFFRECPLSGTLNGLIHTERPILGAIHHPQPAISRALGAEQHWHKSCRRTCTGLSNREI
jgi:fructose-1,6-bisphosphatase/inositol monophosphatase family enzyme